MATPGGGAPVGDEARAEWRCRFCGTTSSAFSNRCSSCGAAREAASSAAAGTTEPAGTAAAAVTKAGRGRGKALAAVAVVAALLGAATAYLGPRRGAETVTVSGFEWERAVEVQDHQT